jgi:hypothetical protein
MGHFDVGLPALRVSGGTFIGPVFVGAQANQFGAFVSVGVGATLPGSPHE